jgi:hypothetical protein
VKTARFVLVVVGALVVVACGGGGESPTSPSATTEPQAPEILVAPVPYDRAQWPHWIDADGDCQDTRAEVLIRDSRGPVTFRDARSCTVATGLWVDPYSGETSTDASDVDIDHVVPLENAHNSGGWEWSRTMKQDYANSLTDPQHLLAVADHVNQAKGSRGPDQWLPPNAAFRCAYVRAWTRIKTSWSLRASGPELRAIAAACP